jgi:two-component system CheB/CheR fusion protein
MTRDRAAVAAACLKRVLRNTKGMTNLPRAMERVVVADDNPAMTAVLKLALRLWGWEVIVAHDGLGAIEAIRLSRPAVALVDIGLPGLNGLEVARVVRATDVAPRLLVAMSGYGEEQDRVRSREAGFDKHLVKPVDPDALKAMLLSARSAGPGGHADGRSGLPL